jgi:hypothetical protein
LTGFREAAGRGALKNGRIRADLHAMLVCTSCHRVVVFSLDGWVHRGEDVPETCDQLVVAWPPPDGDTDDDEATTTAA